MDNVARGMVNIGQPWATAPSRYVLPMDGTIGQTAVIPGISSTSVPENLVNSNRDGTVGGGVQAVTLFTTPQGIYNTFSGTWESPHGHRWNGKYWYEPKRGGTTTRCGTR